MGVDIEPKFVSFDMNGTLIQYRHDETIRKVLGDRLPAEIVDDFELAGEQIRFDESWGVAFDAVRHRGRTVPDHGEVRRGVPPR